MKFDLELYQYVGVRPLTGSIGAEIDGIDASRPLAEPVRAEMKRALAQFHVLFLRDQQLDGDALLVFASQFGNAGKSPLANVDTPLIGQLRRAADTPADVRNSGDRWHMDRANDPMPVKGFALYCEEAPEYGGDTLFASLCQAYDGLPADLQDRCRHLTGIHSMSGVFNVDGHNGKGRDVTSETFGDDKARLDYIRGRTEHPLICRHPDTGRPLLFVSGAYLVGIKELAGDEGAQLVEQLNNHVIRPEFTCRFRWQKGSLALLDNRVTQHYAVNDYAGFARTMLRVELSGDWKPNGIFGPIHSAPPAASARVV